MVDYTSGGDAAEKRKPGCLSVLLIIILLLGGLGAAFYFLLPSIVAKSTSGGGLAYRILPEEVRSRIDSLDESLDMNLNQLEQYGLNSAELARIVESVDFDTAEIILQEFDTFDTVNTATILEILGSHIDLSPVNTEKLERDYEMDLPLDDLKKIKIQTEKNPLVARTAFNLFKETIIRKLELMDDLPENKDSSGSSTTKKKK